MFEIHLNNINFEYINQLYFSLFFVRMEKITTLIKRYSTKTNNFQHSIKYNQMFN